MNITAIIPSALRTIPGRSTFWLERALATVARQTRPPAEIIVATDPGANPPQFQIPETPMPIRWIAGDIPGHQSACNAAVTGADSPLIAFLEDDDLWEQQHLEIMHGVLTA